MPNIAANEDTYKFRDSSSGVSVGVGSGVSVGASYNKSKSDSITYTNANLQAGGNIVTSSGRDTNIAGANLVTGKLLDVNVGRDLYIATLQNSTQSESYGGSFTVGTNSASVSVSASQGDRKFSDNQTTLIGQEGVRVNVGNHTQLDGALIANIDAKGTDQGNLLLKTNTLGFTDLKDDDDSWSHSVSVSVSEEGKRAPGAKTDGSPVTYAGATQDMDGITRATVGAGQIIVGNNANPDLTGLNRDVSKAQEIFKAESSKGEITVKIPASVVESVKDAVKAAITFNTPEINAVAAELPAIMEGEAAGEKAKKIQTAKDEYADSLSETEQARGIVIGMAAAEDPALQAQIDAAISGCGGSASLLDWFIAPAYANGCGQIAIRLESGKGSQIVYMSDMELMLSRQVFQEMSAPVRPVLADNFAGNVLDGIFGLPATLINNAISDEKNLNPLTNEYWTDQQIREEFFLWGIGAATGGLAKEIKVGTDAVTTALSSGSIQDILMPGGNPVGVVYKSARVDIRTLSNQEFSTFEQQLMSISKEATPPPTYNGSWYELPNNQGYFGVRNSLDNGKTLDISVPNVPDVKRVHVQ